ncbi:MAG: amino acid permease [Chloroflexi bacterium]|nr:amino acid permease [Chloroflexota bacterium]
MVKVVEGRALKRTIGLGLAITSGVGVIVGAGIYALIGAAAGMAGNAAWISFLMAGVVAAFTGLSYARMARRVPKDSPEFQYSRVGLGFSVGFMAGWLMVWADLVAAAAVALGFGGYFQSLADVPSVPAALGLVAVLSLIAWVGIQESVLLVAALSVLEVAGLVVVATLGIPHWGEQPLLEAPQGLPGMWTAATLGFFAFVGFDELGNLAEEMRHPERDLPRAITLALAISGVLYVLVAVSAVSLVGWQVLARSSAPLADAVAAVLGERGRTALAVIALAATTNTVLVLLISASRALYGMAQAGALPRALAWIGRRHTPWASILLVWALASLFGLLGDIAVVAQMSNFLVLAAYGMVNLSLAALLRRESRDAGTGGARSGRSVSRYSGVLPALGLITCLLLLVRTGWTAITLGLALAVVGLALGQYLKAQRGEAGPS